MIQGGIMACIIFLFAACSVNKSKGLKAISGMPPCMVTKIEAIKNDPKQILPQSVSKYSYNGQTVFYVVEPCCDQFNSVYDSDCNYLGAPDGGITGKGDGKLYNFFAEAKDKKVVWEINKQQ